MERTSRGTGLGGVTSAEAARLVADAERARAAVLAGAGPRHAAWLVGMAVLTPSYYAGLGVAAAEPEVLVVSLVFAGLVGALSLSLLPGARVARLGLPRRFGLAVGGWGLLFGLTLPAGLLAFPAEPAYWVPAGLLTALPLALGARAEGKA